MCHGVCVTACATKALATGPGYQVPNVGAPGRGLGTQMPVGAGILVESAKTDDQNSCTSDTGPRPRPGPQLALEAKWTQPT